MIDLDSDRPAWRQIADLLRARIVSGELRVGARVPGEIRLAQEYGVSRVTVQQAMDALRREALVVTRAPDGSRVRADGTYREVEVSRPAELVARPATPTERRALNLDEAALVFEVRTDEDEEPVIFDAMWTRLIFD